MKNMPDRIGRILSNPKQESGPTSIFRNTIADTNRQLTTMENTPNQGIVCHPPPVRSFNWSPNDTGIDATWTSPIQVYLYLYYEMGERTLLRLRAGVMRRWTNQIVVIWHRCIGDELQLRVGITDEGLMDHLRLLLREYNVEVPRPIRLPSGMWMQNSKTPNNLWIFQAIFKDFRSGTIV